LVRTKILNKFIENYKSYQMASMLASLGRRERNVNINVGSFSETRKHSDKSRWICIYPAYLNSKKTILEGRQIPAKIAVENPTCNEIKDVLVNAGFNVEIEINKGTQI
jgi:hypothetical protein